jgi:hypothetical protein
MQDPTTKTWSNVPYQLAGAGGSEYLDPTKLGTTLEQPWGQPSGFRTTGFDRATDLGGKWVMPGIYGYGEDRGDQSGTRYSTENLLGYGLPQFLADEYFNTGADFEWGKDYGVNPSEGGGGLS